MLIINLSNFSFHQKFVIFILLVRLGRGNVKNVLISQFFIELMLINLLGDVSQWEVFDWSMSLMVQRNIFRPTGLFWMIAVPGHIWEIVDSTLESLISAFAAILAEAMSGLLFWSIELVGHTVLFWGGVGMGIIWPIVLSHIDVVRICNRLHDFGKFVTIGFRITVRRDIFFVGFLAESKCFLAAHLFIDQLSVCLIRFGLHCTSISWEALLFVRYLIWPAAHLPYGFGVHASNFDLSPLGLLAPIIIVPDHFLLDE